MPRYSSLRKEEREVKIGIPELMIVLVIALVIFGPSKLPALGEGLGKAIRGFKEGLKDKSEEKAALKKAE
jgi:sec-independent protein translocase protein TatA